MNDPFEIINTLIYKIRKDGEAVAYGRGIRLAEKEPTKDEIAMFFDSIIKTCQEKF